MKSKHLVLVLIGVTAILATVALVAARGRGAWSNAELAALEDLWLGSLPPLPADPSNAYADDPRAAELGQRLFFDTRLSGNGRVACATCHLPELAFTDGLELGRGVGVTDRKTMTITGTAYSPWLFWDGRSDSQWSQALGPLESAVEHGGDRTRYAHFIAEHYRSEYEAIFGPLPALAGLPAHAGPVADEGASAAWEAMAPADREAVTVVYANLGKAIAAYERLIMPGPSRFDEYVEAVLQGDRAAARGLLSEDELAGLRLFVGEAGCTNCHNGPLLTNNEFHNTGVPARAGLPEDLGRARGAVQVKEGEFNCLSPYSDAQPEQCMELRFLKTEGHELERAFKPPTLRNVAEAAPYMHAGQFATLGEVLEHYNAAPAAPAGHSELAPLGLSERELGQLEAFLRSLSAPLATPAEWLRPPAGVTVTPAAERVDPGPSGATGTARTANAATTPAESAAGEREAPGHDDAVHTH